GVSRLLRLLVVAVACSGVLSAPTEGANPPGSQGPPGTTLGAPSAPGPESIATGFQDNVVFSGLTQPTVIRWAPDGRIFIAQAGGKIVEYDSLTDPTPTTVIDISNQVDRYWDRGLLGMAIDPNFPASPYIYILYTYDAPIGGTAPVWNDACPTPPGPTTDGCVVSGRLSRLTLNPSTNVATNEQVLINEWCQQFPSHSIGDLVFGQDGMLYVTGGEGASFNNVDYGQYGGSAGSPTLANPCGDPPGGAGNPRVPPTAAGGSLRSQSVRRAAGEPVLLNGAILRLDPTTGAAAPGNPLSASSDPNARRIVGYGFRNPFRFTMRPGTNDVWIGDVGWNNWEEIDHIPNPTAGPPPNFGWPCYEGTGPQPGYQSANLNLCNSLYNGGGSSTGTFGNTTVGTLVDSATVDFKEVSKYTAVASSVTKVTGYISGLGATSGTQPVKAVIYGDSGGSPGALLGVSNPVTVTAGQAWNWVDFTFASPVTVPAGQIWMGYIAGSVNNLTQMRYVSQSGGTVWNINSGGYAAGPTNPFGSSNVFGASYSLYATY